MLLESVQPYSYRLAEENVEWREGGALDYIRLRYEFEAGEYGYGVTVEAYPPRDKYLEISFGAFGESLDKVINEGNVFRIMRTVTNIIKEVGMNWGSYFKGFKFVPASEGFTHKPEETRRGKMFKRYIKKTVPSASISSGNDMMYVDIG